MFSKQHVRIAYGNVLEWYDLGLFGYFSIVIAAHFFSFTKGSFDALFFTYLIFAISFIARPVGGIIFGSLGDCIGKRFALNLSVSLIALPTVIIGLTPSFNDIGWTATIIIVLARIMQGVCSGGQYTGALVLTLEKTPSKHSCLGCSINYISSTVGLGLSSCIAFICLKLIPVAYHDLAWRIPFLLSPILLLGYFWLNRAPSPIEQTQNSQSGKDKKSPKFSLRQLVKILLTKHYYALLFSATLMFVYLSIYYILFVFLMNYFVTSQHLSLTQSLTISSFCLGLSCVSVLVFSYCSDWLGKKTIAVLALIGIIIAIPFCFDGFPLTNIYMHCFLIAVLLTTLASAFIASSVVISSELFPQQVRYSGFAISYNLGACLGGIGPAIVTWLISHYGVSGLRYYLLIIALVGLLVLWCLSLKKSTVVERQYAID